MATLMVGVTLSHYQILEQIGAGGMGVVYRAHDLRLGRDVALKVLSPELADNQNFLARFRREALTLSKLNHPNIATIFDFDTQGTTSFIVMELVQGPGIIDRIRNSSVSEKALVRIGAQLLDGLSAAHLAGVIHRDLKPGNLRETLDGRLKILDFGLATLLRSDMESTQSVLETSGLVGTLPYMAPEQLRGEDANIRTDLYSAGAVLYELATGSRVCSEKFGPLLTEQILHHNPASVRELNPGISREVEWVIHKALEKDPRLRYASAAEMRVAIEQAGQPGSAKTPESNDAPVSQMPPMEIAHVLFTDIVGYSKLAMDDQQRQLRRLQEYVRSTAEFERAKANDKLISLPTGDGMALVFFGEPEAPARCAVELGKRLRSNPEIKLRMGINSGPVYRVADINANRNVAGGGINIAQRVMDCGDAGHILVSKTVADVLSQLSSWHGNLSDLGEAEVKHGVLVHIYNLNTPDAGNPDVPGKISSRVQVRKPSGIRWLNYAAALAILAVLGTASFFLIHRSSKSSDAETNPGPVAPAAPVAPARTSLAVVGFQNITGQPAEDWLSTALTEDLTTELAASKNLRVIPGEEVSIARIESPQLKVASFGRETLQKFRRSLASDYVISGAYWAAGSSPNEQIRVDFRLQNANSGEMIDASEFSSTVGDLKGLTQQAATKYLASLKLLDDSAQSPAAPLPTNPSAARFYAQGLEKLRNFDPLSARDLFQRSIAAEPNLAVAHSSLAESWSALGYDKEAEQEAKRAMELSKTLPVESRRAIEGRYFRLSSRWDDAVKTYASLWGVYQDEPAYALNLAEAQVRAGNASEAVSTLHALKQNPQWKDDPRIDLSEAYAASSTSDFVTQQTAAASAGQKASKNGSKFLAAQAYWLECGALLELGKNDLAESACRQSMQAATAAPVYMARSQTVLASILTSQGKTSEAMELRLGALRTARDIHSNRDIIGALMNLGNLLATQGNLEQAKKNYEEAFAVAKEIGDTQHVMNLQSEMAADLAAQGHIEDAVKSYELSLSTAKQLGNANGIAGAYQNIGLLLLQSGELSEAEHNVQQAWTIALKADLKSVQAQTKSLLGDIYLEEGKLNEAQKSNEFAMNIYRALKQPSGIADCEVSLANVALERNQAAQAENLARQAANEYQTEKMVAAEAGARDVLARALSQQGKLAEAKTELDAASQLEVPDEATRLGLQVTRARLLAQMNQAATGTIILGKALSEADRLRLKGQQLEIRLLQLEIVERQNRPVTQLDVQQLVKDAREKGFVRIANKAEALHQSAHSVGPNS